MYYLKKYALIFGLLTGVVLAGYVSWSEIARSGSDPAACSAKYLEDEIKEIQSEVNRFLRGDPDFQFSHPVLLYCADSLVYWNDFPYFVPEEIWNSGDTMIRTDLNNDLIATRTLYLGNDYTLRTGIPLVKNDTYMGSKPDRPSCWCMGKALSFENNSSTLLSVSRISIPIGWIWTYIIAALLGALGLAFYTDQRLSPENHKKKQRSVLVFFGSLFLLLIPTTFSPFFSGHWLTRAIQPNEVIGINLLLLLVFFSGILYYFSAFQIDRKKNSRSDSNTRPQYLWSILLYGSIAITGILTVYLIEWIHNEAEIDFNLEQLYSISPEKITFLLIFLLIFSLYFSFSSHVYRYIQQSGFNLAEKMAGIVIGLILLIITFILGPVRLDFIPLSLIFLIFIISMDLYQDRRSLNSTWAFTWMILITAFLSLFIFHLDFRHDIEERKDIASSILYDRDPLLEHEAGNLPAPGLEGKYRFIPVYEQDSWLHEWKKKSIFLRDSSWFNPLTGSYLMLSEKRDNLESIGFLCSPKQGWSEKQRDFIFHQTFGIYHHDSLLFSQNNLRDLFTVPNDLDSNPTVVFRDGHSAVIYRGNDQLTLMQVSRTPGMLRPISLFSLLFFLLSLSLFVISILNILFRFIPEHLEFNFFEKKSLRNRIQISIISLIIASFLVIGAVSNYYLQALARESNRFAQLDHADLVINRLSRHNSGSIPRTVEEQLALFAQKESQAGRDVITFYDAAGLRIPSSNAFRTHHFVENQLIPQDIFTDLSILKKQKSYYFPGEGKQDGVYFGVPIKGSTIFGFIWGKAQLTGGTRISDILATFLSIYTLLFILSGVIAIALSNSITRPIEMLGRKLKGLKLSKKNEPVQWKNEDEIGSLITIYNEMIQKLSENAKVMAKVERDAAWKEMAKQVAHEIKNPLTPLKLNIQYLESKIRMNPEDAREIVGQISPGLIEQIDNLSQIASEFSNFAQLPSARNEKIRLNEIVKTVHDFFRKREDLEFKLFVPINDILVFADRNHLIRILNNVVKNAIQAIPPDRDGEIILKLYTSQNDAVILVRDNGTGIPPEMQDKVFSPNFTTKSSGTGLGLAISLNMLESFNGRIHFETEVDKGTDFYIEIPLMRLGDNYPEAQRILLDD
jgi:signal transduction histidine kinase